MEDSNTKVLLHFDGANGSTTFTDSSQSPHTFTANGNAQLSTAQKEFGTASGLFDGTGDYIDTPDSEDFDVGSGNFTVDFWAKRNSNGLMMVFGQCDSTGSNTSRSITFVFDGANKPDFQVFSGATMYDALSSTAITDVNWHHYAGVRNGNTLTLYIDGASKGTANLTGITINNSPNRFAIGRTGERTDLTQYLNGYIDEFRFVKGVAKWITDFTPPATPYSYGWGHKIFGVTPVKIFGSTPIKVNGVS